MPNSTFQLEKQDLMNVASGGWIDSKVNSLKPFFDVMKHAMNLQLQIIASYFELTQRSNTQKVLLYNLNRLYGVL